MKTDNTEEAYLALIRDNRIYDFSLTESASILVKQCAITLSASRTSIWVSYDDASVLHCLSLYRRDTDDFESGAVLNEVETPRYFAALGNERIIDARDAIKDNRTSELAESYLVPLNICSLLDASLRNQGRVKGVVCVEMMGHQRVWAENEKVFVSSIADLFSQRMIVDDLARSESNYKALYEYTSEGIVVFSGAAFSDVNPAICKMFGGEREELIGKSPIDLSPEIQKDGQCSEAKALGFIGACLQGTPQNFEWTHTRIDGKEFFADVTLNAVKFRGEDTLFALMRDITDKKFAEEQANIAKNELEYRAAHDPLTGLMNRYQLHNHINKIINRESLENITSGIALLLLDLNRFKEVNDTLGHATGDKVLVQLAAILNESIEELGGCLFRLGGDEFVAVFDAAYCSEPFQNIESILHKCLKKSISLDDISIEMSASIGIALYPENGKDSHELLRCADVAMYHAKNNDGVSAWYDSTNDLNNRRRLAMIVELGNGINEDQLVLHFQPRIQIETGEVTGCEALIRWQHPRHGMVPPDEFLPLAEMSELIHPLSEWVLINVIKQIKQLTDRGHRVPVAMNISARNLTDSHLADKLQSLIITENIAPDLLEIEITESALINHPQRAVESLEQLDKLGVKIAIDDFGTGYSSLSYLKKLPLNILKVDRSFVMDMLTDDSDSVIVDSTINLAHNFSLIVVAEGVEDQATLDELAVKNCDQAQGFFIAKPMPAEALITWLDEYEPRQYPLRSAA